MCEQSHNHIIKVVHCESDKMGNNNNTGDLTPFKYEVLDFSDSGGYS